ncbi:MAG: ABC transporter permease [Blastocatellales bacterium]
MNGLLQDLKYGLRTILNSPGFSVVAILTLAIGIGATTAIFSVADAAIFRGLPYTEPDRLYHLWEGTPQAEFPRREASWPDFIDWRRNQVFEECAAYVGGNASLVGDGEPERIFTPGASANFFRLLGVNAELGRTFKSGDDNPGAERVAILTHSFWMRKFAGDADVIGRSIELSGIKFTIVGVLPESFSFALRPADIWIAYQPSGNQMSRRGMHGTNVIARLRKGVTIDRAYAEMNTIAQRIAVEHKESHAGTGIILMPLADEILGPVKSIVMALLAAVGLVLLISCSNVAGLMIARSTARQKEVSVRLALGAGRLRLVRQLLTESLLLSLAGGIGGLLIAYWGVDVLTALIPQDLARFMPYLGNVGIDSRILLFALAVSIITGLAFGLAPAIRSSYLNPNDALKSSSRSIGPGGHNRIRQSLVIAEIAVAVVLLVGAGLMVRSLVTLLSVDPGFKAQNLLTMTVSVPRNRYQEPQKLAAFHRNLIERAGRVPGVESSGIVNMLPLTSGDTNHLVIAGRPAPPPGFEIEANYREVSGDYWKAAGIPLIAGRGFDQRDDADSPQVTIINRSFAEKYFGVNRAVGQRVFYPGNPESQLEIVGVVGDVKITGLDADIKPVMYVPLAQSPSYTINLVIRSAIEPESLVSAVRSAIREIEPIAVVYNASTMDEKISQSVAAFTRRYPAVLMGVFAAVAVLLASIGIYGMISYSVIRQTRDIGVRMALGADPRRIFGMLIRQGMLVVLAGLAIGIPASLGVAGFLRSLLYQVDSVDTVVYTSVVIGLAVIAGCSCMIPALRASKIDPMTALRDE